MGVLLVSTALIASVRWCATRPPAPPMGSPKDTFRNDLGALHRAAGLPRRDARSPCRPRGREHRVASRDSARSLTRSSAAASRTSSLSWLRVLPGTSGTRSPRSGATRWVEDHRSRTRTILSSRTCESGRARRRRVGNLLPARPATRRCLRDGGQDVELRRPAGAVDPQVIGPTSRDAPCGRRLPASGVSRIGWNRR